MALGNLRRKVFKQTLEPAGFIKTRQGLFLRQAGTQLHGFEYQLSRFGGEYFVNVAFGYDFLPSWKDMDEHEGRRVTPLAEYGLLDFMMHARPGGLMPKEEKDKLKAAGHDPSGGRHGFMTDEAQLEQMDRHARDALAVLARAVAPFHDPSVFLALVPPDMLEEDLRQRLARTPPPYPMDLALPGWNYGSFDLACALMLIALRAEPRRTDLAERYYRFAEGRAKERGFERVLAPLRRQLEDARLAR